MTDAADTVAARLLALQHTDTLADQLTVRRGRLDEREHLAERTALMQQWERRRVQIGERLDALTVVIEDAERANADLGAHRTRLEAQMKTVIAPREAEALMHEIATINEQRDELDDAELVALEEQSVLDDERTAHLGQEESLRAGLGRADEALALACGDIDMELARLAEQRTESADALDESSMRRYEAVRSASGVAVAELQGHRCSGCHLDLSAAEVDTAKDEAAESGFTDCPQCGRMLIV